MAGADGKRQSRTTSLMTSETPRSAATHDIYPLVYGAPTEEANFFSLPYILELLHHSLQVEAGDTAGRAEQRGFAYSASDTFQFAKHDIVKECMSRERFYEEHYVRYGKFLANESHLTGPLVTSPAVAGDAAKETNSRAPEAGEAPHSAPSPAEVTEREARGAVPVASSRCDASVSLSATHLLRTGLARALGFHLPAADADEDDLTLGRERTTLTSLTHAFPDPARVLPWEDTFGSSVGLSLSGDPSRAPPLPPCRCLFAEPSADARRYEIVVDWFADVLNYIRRRGFSVVQARSVLLTAVALLETMYSLTLTATEEVVKDAVTEVLSRTFEAQMCEVPTVTIERHVVREVVQKDVRDPAAVAALEQRLQQGKLSNKQRQALCDQLQQLPLVSRAVTEERVEEVEREVYIGPYLAIPEATDLLDFLCASVLQHWRLFAFLFHGTPPVKHTTHTVRLECVAPFCLPPLKTFLPMQLCEAENARQEVWNAAEAAAATSFCMLFTQPLEVLARERDERLHEMWEALAAAERDNLSNALVGEDYERVERTYQLRLRHAADSVLEGSARGVAADADASPAASPPPSIRPSPPASRGGRTGRRSMAGGGSKNAKIVVAPLAPADTIHIVADAVFIVEDVERRVDAATAVALEREQEQRARSKGRGAKR